VIERDFTGSLGLSKATPSSVRIPLYRPNNFFDYLESLAKKSCLGCIRKKHVKMNVFRKLKGYTTAFVPDPSFSKISNDL
jgi:hypothetical protein